MTQLPTEFQTWLNERNAGRAIALTGYIKSATFSSLDQIKETELFVSVDEYIDNYADDANHLAGMFFSVPAYDLLSKLYGYEPNGVLVWLPTIAEFGSFDSDHCVLRSFGNTKWSDMIRDLGKFIDCQWYPERVPNELIRPWQDDRFSNSNCTESPPW